MVKSTTYLFVIPSLLLKLPYAIESRSVCSPNQLCLNLESQLKNGKKNLQNKTSSATSSQGEGNLSRQRPAGRLADQQGGKGPGQARQGTETPKAAQDKTAEVKEKAKA